MSKLALVTGASSGIGRAFAQRLAADGYDLVVTGRRLDRLEELAATLTRVKVEPMTADLSTDAGVDAIAAVCAAQPLAMLVNNAGVAHYMPFADLPADKASELVHVKVAAPAMLARAAVPGMIARGEGTIINVSGMIAFSGPAPQAQLPLRRAVYAGTLDLSAVPRMPAQDVVTASLRGLELGEVVCAPGVEDASLLDAVFRADLAAFGAQSPELAQRYRTDG